MSKKDQNNDENSKKKKRSEEDFPIQEYRLVPADQFDSNRDEDDTIDPIEIAKIIWDNRKTIYKFVLIGAVLGLLVALLSPKEYVSSATLMPEYATEGSSGGASRLLQQYGGLIGLGGGTYNSSSNAIRVELYPQIISSLSFQDKLAREEFYFPDYDTTSSIYDYYLEIKSPGLIGSITKYTIGLPGLIIQAIKREEPSRSSIVSNDEIVRLSKREIETINNLRSRVSASLDEESGIISVSVKMHDPELAANMAKYAIEELTLYLTDYRTEKVLVDLDFVQTQLASAKERFEEAQLVLADFDDSNQGNLTARAQTERQRLQSEYDIAVNVYNTLTQQYEEAKLKVQEETPVFKVLQPVLVPVTDEANGVATLITFIMLSLIGSLSLIFINTYINKYK